MHWFSNINTILNTNPGEIFSCEIWTPMTGSLSPGGDSTTQHEVLEIILGTHYLWVWTSQLCLAWRKLPRGLGQPSFVRGCTGGRSRTVCQMLGHRDAHNASSKTVSKDSLYWNSSDSSQLLRNLISIIYYFFLKNFLIKNFLLPTLFPGFPHLLTHPTLCFLSL